jgi:membrane-bound serine protease (ClpP class)
MLALAFTLILVGCLLMAVELVLFTHGVLAMIGLGGVIVGTVFVFGQDPFLGVATLLILFGFVIVLAKFLHSYWRYTPMGKRLLLEAPTNDATIASLAVHQELERLRGKVGKTLSALRPAGTVDFDGRRIDTISEGILIEPGQWVRCIDVQAGKVVVRQVDGPPRPEDLENMQIG